MTEKKRKMKMQCDDTLCCGGQILDDYTRILNIFLVTKIRNLADLKLV